MPSPSLTDPSGYRFYDSINTMQWIALMQATADATDPNKFMCLAPICRNPDRQIEKRKAFAVTALLNMLAVGVDPDDVPPICDCDDLPPCVCLEELQAGTYAALPVPQNVADAIAAAIAAIP